MDEELDYMSDDFIASCTKGLNDVRPGLLNNRRELREHELIKKKQLAMIEKKKPIQVYQTEVLEEGLKQPINSSNKGFSMLQKMGFKSGMGLGKNNDGMTEPISLNIKNNKQGLGHKIKNHTLLKQKTENKLDEINEKDFTMFLSKKNKEKKTTSDLRKSQRICKELDIKTNKTEPETCWFWPKEDSLDKSEASVNNDEENISCIENSEDIDNDEEITDEEKLELITKYLRETYYYCIWCSVQYYDEKDLEECPGSTRDDH